VNKKRANIVALGGMISALSLLVMLLTRIIPFTEQAMPAIAGVLLLAAVMELGPGWSFVVYIAVSLLSMLFAAQNGAAFYYLLFFGHYTILKNYIEHIHNRIFQWVVKLALFNFCAVIVYFVTMWVSGVPESITKYGLPITMALINVVFILYDIALSRLVVTYAARLGKLFARFH
jgi:hypothetical protein